MTLVLSPELDAYVARRLVALAAVRAVLIERLHLDLHPDAIQCDVPLFGTGLALDSVDALELIVSLEHAFGRPLPTGRERRRVLRTVGTVVAWAVEGGS